MQDIYSSEIVGSVSRMTEVTLKEMFVDDAMQLSFQQIFLYIQKEAIGSLQNGIHHMAAKAGASDM